MEIVSKTYTVHVPVKVIADSSTSTWLMDTDIFDYSIVRVLNNISQMKVLTEPAIIMSEFDLFLQYAQAKTDGSIDEKFDAFDSYLGSLGV